MALGYRQRVHRHRSRRRHRDDAATLEAVRAYSDPIVLCGRFRGYPPLTDVADL
jgi:hypothetical protein